MTFIPSTILVCCIALLALDVTAQVKCGIDNLIDTDFAMLRGKKVVLVTHAAARTYRGTSTAEEFLHRTDVTTLRLLAPEHGYFGVVGAGKTVVDDTVMGVPVVSLYGPKRRPDKAMLEGADVIVVDMQDIGVRSYTYISTMTEVMEACALWNVRMMILDRPNPLGGVIVEGNLPDDTLRSFIGRLPIPYIHGMTMGELATMANAEGWLTRDSLGATRTCPLTVVRCKRWKRSMTWEETGLRWYATSPNIPNVHAVRGYAMTGLLGELGPCSIGMGTASPFTVIGAPDFPRDTLLEIHCLRYGVFASRARFQPSSAKYANTVCEGYYLSTQRSWKPYHVALTLLWRLRVLRSESFPDTLAQTKHGKMFAKACGSSELVAAIVSGKPLAELERIGRKGVVPFVARRKKYLLYD
ncbi:MAG TPA: DUF1343 domain-containing protein [Candidatus Didemnitutus sp.]|nr:DUF1343 domain-containing protein [Candidatus Didemnitutus sp.]